MAREGPLEPEAMIGQVLAGKFRVERVLGAGGMGMVVAASHLVLDQRVALKFLLPEFVSSAEASQRFLREARAAVRIRSENVARIIDVGQLDNGAPYIVMESLEGEDLARRLESGPLPTEEAVEFVIQACDALAEAHGAGIVHRDLKPGNLFLTRRTDGSTLLKVLDFGISKMGPNLPEGALTKSAVVMGSPYYMSPEQLRSPRDVDYRTDVWSLGVILYELLTGHLPFSGETLGALSVAIVTETPQPLREHRPDLPVGLDAVVLRALEKDPGSRPVTVAELAAELAPYATERARLMVERIGRVIEASPLRSSAPPPRPSGVPARSSRPSKTTRLASTTQGTASDGSRRPPGRGATLRIVASVLALLCAGGLGAAVFAWRARAPARSPERDPSSSQPESIAGTSLPVETGAPAPRPDPLVTPVLESAAPPSALVAPTPSKLRVGAKPPAPRVQGTPHPFATPSGSASAAAPKGKLTIELK